MLDKTFEELKLSGDMPSPSGVGMRVLEITSREDFSTSDLGDTIRADSALTGRILKLANAASRAGVEPVTTVSDSIMRLGTRAVRDLALAFSLVSGNRKGKTDSFNYDLYWSQSLARAVCAQEVCRHLRQGKPEEAYICGLLSDIGQLALASVYAESYAKIWLRYGAVGEMAALRDLELETYEIQHGQICVFLMKEWGLPDVFGEAVDTFTQNRLIGEEEGSVCLTTILRCAETLSSFYLCKSEEAVDRRAQTQVQLNLLREALNLQDDDELEELKERCLAEWYDWGKALGVETEKVAEFRTSAQAARDALASEEPSEEDLQAAEELHAPKAADPEESVVAPEAGPEVEAEGDLIRVLAVDDDPVSLKMLSRHLERWGYEVLLAKDGQAALQMALMESPDIVISDWRMPEIDGLELCRRLRRIPAGRRMFFLLLTGQDESERVVEAFESGVDDYISKPFIPRVLAARVKGGTRLVHLQRKVDADHATMMKQVTQLGKMTRQLRAAAMTDPLTQLPNRRYAMKRLENEWDSVDRTGRALSTIMMDIDHFKSVNDNFGHDVGDAVLVETAKVLRRELRNSDEVCRMGGEEFLAICRGTDAEQAHLVAERLRVAIEENVIHELGFGKAVTMSLGVGTVESVAGDSISRLLKRSDEAVYLAKNSGRNRVCGSPEYGQRESA